MLNEFLFVVKLYELLFRVTHNGIRFSKLNEVILRVRLNDSPFRVTLMSFSSELR